MAKSKRPAFKANDLVTLRFASIAAYGGKPFVGKDALLRVQSLAGTGTLRNPWYVIVTDDAGHKWTLQPGDLLLADASSTSRHHVTKSAAQLKREVDAALVHGRGGDRVLADLESWGVDRTLVNEVRSAFRSGDHRQAMALARDLGWNRASKRGRVFR